MNRHCCVPCIASSRVTAATPNYYPTDEDGVNLELVDPSGRMWCDFLWAFCSLPQNLWLIKIVDLKFNKASRPRNSVPYPGVRFSEQEAYCTRGALPSD